MVKAFIHIIVLILLLSSCEIARFHRDYTEYDFPPFEDEDVKFYDINFELDIDENITNKDELVEHTINWVKKYFISLPRYFEQQREVFKSDEDIDLNIDYEFEFDIVKAEGVCVYDKKKQFFCKVIIEFNEDVINFKYFQFKEYERYSNKESDITKGVTLNKIHKKLWSMTNKFFE